MVTLHAVLALVMNGTKDFGDVGPLPMPTVTGRAEEALIAPVGAIGAEEALNRCFPRTLSGKHIHISGDRRRSSRPLVVCGRSETARPG